MRRRALAGALGAAAALAAAPRAAEACFCEARRLVSPANGSVGVPLDPEVIVAGDTIPWWLELRAADGGVSVALELDRRPSEYANWDWIWYARALEPLEPDTIYELFVPPAWGNLGEGDRVLSRFRTGDGASEQPPRFEGASAVTIRRYRREEDCSEIDSCYTRRNGFDRVVVEYGPVPAGAAHSVLELGRADGEMQRFLVPIELEGGSITLTSAYCDAKRLQLLEEGQTYCADLRVVSHAGDVSSGGESVCEVTESCRLRKCAGLPGDECKPMTACSVGGGAGWGWGGLLLVGALVLSRGGERGRRRGRGSGGRRRRGRACGLGRDRWSGGGRRPRLRRR